MSPTHRIAEAVAEYIVEPSRVRVFEVISTCNAVEHANAELRQLTGIRNFFPDPDSLAEFHHVFARPASNVDVARGREWGDYQTPSHLAAQVCDYLAQLGLSPEVIIEPTYGAGNFVLAALQAFPSAKLIYGVEIQEKYEWHLKTALLVQAVQGQRFAGEVVLHRDDIFTHSFSSEIFRSQNTLIIGNPPWITNAELSALESNNVPQKRNIKALSGLDALTGKSNFDLGEFVLLRLLDLFAGQHGTLAMLCKNAVIKNIVEQLPQRRYSVANMRAFEIDARREFGAAVKASLLAMDLGSSQPTYTCRIASLDDPKRVTRTFGWADHHFVSSVEDYEDSADFEGTSPLIWRQGLKHDCASIMELDMRNGITFNDNNETVNVEDEWVYWLLKSSDLKNFEVDRARKKVIVPQRYLGEDTSPLREFAPKLWHYLAEHGRYFERRKSSIYRNKPRFSIFGIGEYSFRPYKVAIAGLYKEPRFSLVLPIDGRPVMLDDTCYFLGFGNYVDALFTVSLLNCPLVKRFLQSIVFTDSKRPYTKGALMRIDLARVASHLSFQALCALWSEISYQPRAPVVESDFEGYKQHVLANQSRQKL